jgi:ABC-2 type transport system permease protein
VNSVRLILRQVRYENRAFRRNPASAFFTLAFPLLFMVVINLVFASAGGDQGSAFIDFYTPAIIAFGIINATFTSLAMTVAIARDDGLLKRIHGTPLPTLSYLTARVLHNILIGLLLAAIVGTVGTLLLGVRLDVGSLPLLLLVLVLGSATFSALGLAVSGLIPSAQAAPAVVNAIVLPLLFISNIFIQVDGDGSSLLATISMIFPVRHFADALQAVYHPATLGPLDPIDLVWLAGWGVIGIVAAWRTFSWEPRT